MSLFYSFIFIKAFFMEGRSTARFVALSYFFVLLFGLVLDPIWLTSDFSYPQQVIFVTGVVVFIGGFAYIFYWFLSQARPQNFGLKFPANRNSVIFGVIVIAFIGLNLLNVGNGIQNCGDENLLLTSALDLKDILLKIFWGSPLPSIFTGLSLLLMLSALVFGVSKKHIFVKLLLTYLGVFSLAVVYLELFDSGVRSLLGSPSMLMRYSPLSLWLKVPALFLAKNPDMVLRWYSLVVSVASLCVVYLFFRKLYSERAALVAAALYAFSPIFLLYSTSMYLEASYNLFFLLALFFFLTFLRDDDGVALGLAVVFANVSFFLKFQGILLLLVFFIAYATQWFKGARKVRLMRDLFFLALVLFPYLLMYKLFGTVRGGRGLGIPAGSLKHLLNFDLVSVYPKMLVEQFTLPVAIIFVMAAMYYLWRKQRDVLVVTGVLSLIIAMALAVLDGPYFIGADYGRFVFPMLIFVPGFCGLFLSDALRQNKILLFTASAIVLYMISSAFFPLPFEKMHYLGYYFYTHKYRPFEQPNSRLLPSRELAEKMLALNLSGEKILYLGYFPQATYGRIFGLPATFLTFQDFFDQVPPEQQNARSLLSYVHANQISYIILPMLLIDNYREWWYSCAYMSFEYGDKPEKFIPQVVREQKQFTTVLTASNPHGSLYLLRPNK